MRGVKDRTSHDYTGCLHTLPSLCLPDEIIQKPTRLLDQDYVGFDTQKASIAFQESGSAPYVPDARDGRAISALSLVASAITCRSLTTTSLFQKLPHITIVSYTQLEEQELCAMQCTSI